MARKIIGKKTITFYEGDEELLSRLENAAKADQRTFASFALKALIDKVGEPVVKVNKEETPRVPTDSKEELKGW